jgi:hypothetical protein
MGIQSCSFHIFGRLSTWCELNAIVFKMAIFGLGADKQQIRSTVESLEGLVWRMWSQARLFTSFGWLRFLRSVDRTLSIKSVPTNSWDLQARVDGKSFRSNICGQKVQLGFGDNLVLEFLRLRLFVWGWSTNIPLVDRDGNLLNVMSIIVRESTLAKSTARILHFVDSCLIFNRMRRYEFWIRTFVELHFLRFAELVIFMVYCYGHSIFFSILVSMELLRTKILLHEFAIQ